MLRESFIFLDRVSDRKESLIWGQGVRDWNDFLSIPKIRGFSRISKDHADGRIKDVRQLFFDEDMTSLARAIPSTEQWRLFADFCHDAVFLDIETEGYYGNVTVVGLYDGRETKTFVRGVNLDRSVLQRELAKHKLVVTYNGSSFDLPVLERYFNMRFDVPHVDLRGVCSRVGLRGGLKSIERQLGIFRPDSLKYVGGDDAAELWRCWKATGDRDYLDMLVAYNEEDVVNLLPVAKKAVGMLWEKVREGKSHLF